MRNLFTGLLLLGLAACDPGPPVACVQSLPEQELYVGESNYVTPCFDAEALPLLFETEVSDPAVITGEVFGSQVEITAEAVGNAVVTIRAVDNNNLTATQTVLVTVPNQAPVVKDQFQYTSAIWSQHEVDLSRYIDDPDRQQLTYRVSVYSGAADVELEVDGDMLHIYGRERGEIELDIIAIDPEGESLTHAGQLTLTDPRFYITQAAHSKSRDVPLLKDKDGLLRVFLTTDSFNIAMPTATVAFYDEAAEIHRAYLDSEGTIPERINEGTFDGSYEAEIDGAYIRPGVRLVIEFDSTVVGIERRIEKPLDVIEMPVVEWMLVPVIIGNDRSTIEDVARIVASPETHDVLYETRNALPVGDYVIKAHAPIEITTDEGFQYGELMPKLVTLWETEGRNGYYMGIIPHPISGGVAGAAYVRGYVGYSIMSGETLAHELGHNFSLEHAPCGPVVRPDKNYPYENGAIGIWGYDVAAQRLKRPTLSDLMSYCAFTWISDYSWRLAALYRHSLLRGEQQSRGRPGEMLTVWGWVDENGPVLNPSMYVDGRPTPLSGDSHSIEIRTDQDEVISYRFGLQEIMDGPGGSAFSHLVPVTWDGEVVEIRLEGPEGIASLDASTNQPYSMVIRDGMVEHLGAGEYRAESGERVIFSRGIPVRR